MVLATLNLPAFYWGAGTTAITNYAQFSLHDQPLAANDTLRITIANEAIPATLPGYIRVTGFGNYYLQSRTTDAAVPGVTTFEGSRKALGGTDTAAAILDYLQGSGIPRTILFSYGSHGRWEYLATRQAEIPADGDLELDIYGIQWLIAQKILDKGSTPNLATLRRGLLENGLMLLEGDHNGSMIPGTGLSIVPLEYNRGGVDADGNPVIRALPAGTIISRHKEPLVDALSRKMSVSVQNETLSGGTGGYAEHLGNFERVAYGVIALEQRRYVELLTGETAEARIQFDASYKVGDVVRDGAMRQWRVAGANHDFGGNSYFTSLSLVRHYAPTREQIRQHSPAPFNTETPRIGELPDAPAVSIEPSYVDSAGVTRLVSGVGGALRIRVTATSNRGKPLNEYRVRIYDNLAAVDFGGNIIFISDPVHDTRVAYSGVQPTLEIRYSDLAPVQHTIVATAINEFGEGPYYGVQGTPVAQAPIMLNALPFTGRDAGAFHAPDGMVGGTISKVIEQRLRAATRSHSGLAILRLINGYRHAPKDTRTINVGGVGSERLVDYIQEQGDEGIIWGFLPNSFFIFQARPYLTVFATLIPRGATQYAVRGQYRLGLPKGGREVNAVESDDDIDWDAAWKDWSNADPPPGLRFDPNPNPIDAADDSHTAASWQFSIATNINGVYGRNLDPTTPPRRYFMAMRFRAVVLDDAGNPTGTPGDWLTLNTIVIPDWFNLLLDTPRPTRHFNNEGEQTRAVRFLPATSP